MPHKSSTTNCKRTPQIQYTNQSIIHSSFTLKFPIPSKNMEATIKNCASPESDPPFTDQELRMIEAIEAQYQRSHSTKRQSHHHHHHDSDSRLKTRRQLPSSLFAPPHPFSLSPCQANTRMKYAAMRFGGQILYSRTLTEVEKAAKELLLILEAKKRENCQVAIGFDIEWKPTFQRGALPRKAAVMQICGDVNKCYVLHIIHSGIPPSLQILLEDTAFLKVGAGIGNDAVKVFKDYNVSVKAVEDLSYLAKQKLGGNWQKWGLASLTETLVCKELQKPKKIRLGNWEANVLSKDQLQYAATDAFASWHLYQVLKSLPDIVKDASE